MKKQQFKKIIKMIHLWLGLISGLIVCIVAITGATYVFEKELRNSFQKDFYYYEGFAKQRISLDILRDSVCTAFPKEKISSIRFNGNQNAAYIFYTKNKLIAVNPVSGRIIGERKQSRDFFTVVEKIHTELYLGEPGKLIIRINVLIFFILVITGLILWWPRKWKYFKQAATINFKTKNLKLINRQLHTVFGFYALIILLIISCTGLFFAYENVKKFVSYVTTGSTIIKEARPVIKPDKTKHDFSLKQFYNDALAFDTAQPIETIISLPNAKNALLRIAVRYPYNISRSQNTFLFNANNGELISKTLYKNYTPYDKVAMSNYNLHTGRIGTLGIGSKIVYFMAICFAASLPVTGFLIWYNRKFRNKKRAERSLK